MTDEEKKEEKENTSRGRPKPAPIDVDGLFESQEETAKHEKENFKRNNVIKKEKEE